MRNICLFLFITLLAVSTLPAQTSLQGAVSDRETGDPTIGAEVVLHQQKVFIAKAIADLDGAYFFTDLAPGSYEVTASYVGFEDVRIKKFRVKAGKVNRLDLVFKKSVALKPLIIPNGFSMRPQKVKDSTQPLQKQ